MTKPKKSPKTILIAIGLLVLLTLVAKHFFFTSSWRFAGTLEATKVDLSARLASVIQSVTVREGDRVTVGQKLVALQCDDLKVNGNLADQNFERTQRLFKAGTASKENMDEVNNRKQESDVRLGWCEVTAPIGGTVLSRYREPGEWVNPGTKLLTLANIQEIWTYIYVPQPEVARLKPGMQLSGIVPELKRQFSGTIAKINEEAEFTPKNVQTRSERTRLVYGVKVSFAAANSDEILKPGMTIEIELPRE